MLATTGQTISVVGIDIGKNSFHIVGLDERGAIVLRRKWSRGQIQTRLANLPPCLIGMEACVGAHHLARQLQALGHDARLMPAKYVVTAAIGGHPVHPMLIPFPIAFLVGTLASDLAFWGTHNALWAEASLGLVGAGNVMALVAALAGFTDFFGESRIRQLDHAWYHMLGNLTAVVAAGNFLLRYMQGIDAAILPWGLVLSFVVVGILMFTGWMGWEMVYRHRVGIIDRGARAEAVAERPRRVA